jgi:hypothetical protein
MGIFQGTPSSLPIKGGFLLHISITHTRKEEHQSKSKSNTIHGLRP